jgi:hypothetical protein
MLGTACNVGFQIDKNLPNSLQELADALVDEWSRISQVEFQTLIRIFQNRCRKVIRARGGHTLY